MDTNNIIESLFGVTRALIGVIHLQALPGTPANKLNISEIKRIAVDEAAVYKSAGFHGVLIENTHDRPYLKANVGPEIVAAMSVVGLEVQKSRFAARHPGSGRREHERTCGFARLRCEFRSR